MLRAIVFDSLKISKLQVSEQDIPILESLKYMCSGNGIFVLKFYSMKP